MCWCLRVCVRACTHIENVGLSTSSTVVNCAKATADPLCKCTRRSSFDSVFFFDHFDFSLIFHQPMLVCASGGEAIALHV